MVPSGLTATSAGLKKRASDPCPSSEPELPGMPASVVTSPEGRIRRIVWLSQSPTMIEPDVSRATPEGPLKRASDPRPSTALVAASPAIVVT
jgi:hypothetical protein